MSTAEYHQLETRIKKNDVDGVLARWEFGQRLVAEQDEGTFSKGRMEELSLALEVSLAELYNRRQFARTFPSEEQVRDAFQHWGSWSAICQRGLGRRGLRKGRMQKGANEPWGDDLPVSIAHKAYVLLRKEAGKFLRTDTLDFAMTDVLWDPTPGSRVGALMSEANLRGVDPHQIDELLQTFVELRCRVDRCIAAFRRKLDGWQVTWDHPGPTLLDLAGQTHKTTVTPEKKVPGPRNRTHVGTLKSSA